MEKFQETTKFLLELSQKATDILLSYYVPGGVEAELKEDNSPVTKADLAVNDMVISEIKEKYPEYEVLGEEKSTPECGGAKKLFVVDPLDGTHMFKIGAPLFVFSAAIVINGESVAGVLSNPLAKRTLLAEKGKGTYLVERNEFVHVSNLQTFEGALIEAGWRETETSQQIHFKGGRTPMVYSVCEATSLVATGGFEGNLFSGSKPWDVAAGKIVVEEAGGKVTDLFGNKQRYDCDIKGAIFSNGHLHEKLVAIVKKSRLINRYQ